jgi:hypothetical protein
LELTGREGRATGSCTVTVSDIASIAGLSPIDVLAGIQELTAKGYLVVRANQQKTAEPNRSGLGG